MQIYTSKMNFPKGTPLGGFSSRVSGSNKFSSSLELNGVDISYKGTTWNFCSVDALYCGNKILESEKNDCAIIVASHTHYAPMIDDTKPLLSSFSQESLNIYKKTFETVEKCVVNPDSCAIYSGEVEWPIYRRFDYPQTTINKFFSKFGGFYPNIDQPIDRSIKIIVFYSKNIALFAIAYHACHPVSRSNEEIISPDYIEAIRDAVRQKFSINTCLFFLGCSADIRPNFQTKRISFIPKNRLNLRFNYNPSNQLQKQLDRDYFKAIINANKIYEAKISEDTINIQKKSVKIAGFKMLEIPILRIFENIQFAFFPFEISHRYHLEILNKYPDSFYFLVSCARHTYGYLPHLSQLKYSGYEVDSSRKIMGLQNRIYFNMGQLWEKM